MQDINLYQLLKFYAKKWAWILLITAIGVGGGYLYNTYFQTPLYKSSATLILVSPGEKRTTTQDVTLINNYIQLFKSRRVLEPVIKDQNLDISYDMLVQSIEATNEKNTEVIKVAISTANADVSRKLVEGSVESFKKEAKELYELDNIKLVDGASQPEQPFNVRPELVFATGGIGGFILALISLFFVYDYRLAHPAAPKKEAPKQPKNKQNRTIVQRVAGFFTRKEAVKSKRVRPVKPRAVATRKKSAAVTQKQLSAIAESAATKAKKAAKQAKKAR